MEIYFTLIFVNAMQCLEFRNIKFDSKICQIIPYFNSSLSYIHNGWIYGQIGINSDRV